MRTIALAPPPGARIVSGDGWIPLAASIVDRQVQPVDPVKEDVLAYSFYALLGDAELREVFGNFTVPASGSD
jgi:hypothetical protein